MRGETLSTSRVVGFAFKALPLPAFASLCVCAF